MMPVFLHFYHLTPREYYSLTLREFAVLRDYLEEISRAMNG